MPYPVVLCFWMTSLREEDRVFRPSSIALRLHVGHWSCVIGRPAMLSEARIIRSSEVMVHALG